MFFFNFDKISFNREHFDFRKMFRANHLSPFHCFKLSHVFAPAGHFCFRKPSGRKYFRKNLLKNNFLRKSAKISYHQNIFKGMVPLFHMLLTR